MKKLLPLAVGTLACFVALGSAQAAPASGNVLGKLTTAGKSNSAVEQAHYRRHHRWWWKKRHYRHHHRRHHW